MASSYVWQYILVVPKDAILAADSVSPYLGNPGGIKNTFEPFLNKSYWVASFIATEASSDGIPSKDLLEQHLEQTSELSSILWVRTKNPWHPETTEEEQGKVLATNWNAFPVGSYVTKESFKTAVKNKDLPWIYYLVANTDKSEEVGQVFSPYPEEFSPDYYIARFAWGNNEYDTLSGLHWVRAHNPQHPYTAEAEKNKVAATNWPAFTVGDAVSLGAVIDFLSQDTNSTPS